jgi:hypothetical protein
VTYAVSNNDARQLKLHLITLVVFPEICFAICMNCKLSIEILKNETFETTCLRFVDLCEASLVRHRGLGNTGMKVPDEASPQPLSRKSSAVNNAKAAMVNAGEAGWRHCDRWVGELKIA